MNNSHKAALVILDGWGIGSPDPKINAIAKANMPFIKGLFSKYPNATLLTSGGNVGLPEGQMGNSEVGHLNLGAGRVVYQQLALINKAIAENVLETHPVLLNAFKYISESGKKLHLLGLVSNGGVHSSIDHLKALIDASCKHGITSLFVHAFTDGRDTDPKSGAAFIKDLNDHLKKTTGAIASIVGRYYAMDRDKRWERVKKAYDLLVHGYGEKYLDPVKAIEDSYEKGITDEFINPVVITDDNGNPLATISEGDVVLFFNFRTDRGRQLTQVLTQVDMPEFNMHRLDLQYITMTQYDATYSNVKILFDEDDLKLTLGEVLEKSGKKQLRAAETEKYPHVTFFFSGGREQPFDGEKRILIPSPKVSTYDLKPEMSAPELTNAVTAEVKTGMNDFIVINYANPDMVGHTGIFPAVVSALETVDNCVNQLISAALENGYKTLIIADHGNSEFMVNPDDTPNTAHTTNPVPVILVSNEKGISLNNGRLADIAPTILDLMGLDAPSEMTGHSLIYRG